MNRKFIYIFLISIGLLQIGRLIYPKLLKGRESQNAIQSTSRLINSPNLILKDKNLPSEKKTGSQREVSFLKEIKALKSNAYTDIKLHARYIQLLSNPKLMEQSFLKLNDFNFNQFDQAEIERIEIIQFIVQALELKQNPIKEKIIASIKSFFLNQDYLATQDVPGRKRIVGDKVELLEALYKNSNDDFDDLVSQSTDPHLMKIIDYTKKRIKTNNRSI